jgi:hypothetical protein
MFGPFRLNFSKKGVGYSVGVKGFRVGRDAAGRQYTHTSIPGTGLYSRQYQSANSPQTPAAKANALPWVIAGIIILYFLFKLFLG